MRPKLDGKVAIVTGAGRGIGRAIALKLAEEGAQVVVNDLDAQPAEDVVQAIREAGGVAVCCAGSVVDEVFPGRIVGAALQHLGGLDIIVNNAGYTWDGAIQKMSDDQWASIVDVHLTAPFRLLRAAQPVIRELAKADEAKGRPIVRKVVNVSSLAGLFGNAGQVNYASAKAGVVGLTMALAKEWGRLRTTVNCVAFGLIKTRLTEATYGADAHVRIGSLELPVGVNPDLLDAMERTIPLGRSGTPEEAAGAVYLFCIPESDYVSGQTLLCSGGLMGI